MGICCKLAGLKYDIEQRYPTLVKFERRMCIVEKELNRNNPCFDSNHGGKCVHHKACGCRGDGCHGHHGH